VKIAKAFLEISAQHYPERLGLFWVVDAPSIFNVLWRAIQAFVDPKTYKKIRFLPYDVKADAKQPGSSKLIAEMHKEFDEETRKWMLREMAENRDKAKAASKVYCMSHIHKAASTGDLMVVDSEAQQSGDSHDHRGAPLLLERYKTCPNILEPQASTKV